MDIYLYPFGDPAHPVVLRDVSYGSVSPYVAVSPGEYRWRCGASARQLRALRC